MSLRMYESSGVKQPVKRRQNLKKEMCSIGIQVQAVPSFLDSETIEELMKDPKEVKLLWNRLRHSKCLNLH